MALTTDAIFPEPGALAEVEDLYQRGLFVQALRRAEAIGDPLKWGGTHARILAGRLLRQVGASRGANTLKLRAYRKDPKDPEARYYFLWHVLEVRGPVEAWERLRQFGIPSAELGVIAGDFRQLAGRLLSSLRDFRRAEEWFARARQGTHSPPWWDAEWCEHLQRQDRYDEALEAAQMGLARTPGYWALELSHVRCLMLCGREEEAVQCARAFAESGECAHAASQWATTASELQRHDEVLLALDRVEVLSPRADEDLFQWIRALRALAEYRRGRRTEAAAQARLVGGDGYWKGFAERLEQADDGSKRVELPVGFTRQHLMTCVPATLTTLSRFWGRPADHLEVADAICYDGTASHSERHWAESNGWVAREFRITLDAARALLDRGIPFCLTTVNPANAHEQAVIGYDDLRRSLLIRDPWFRNRYDIEAEALLKSQESSGPRGMAMVPVEQAALLEGIELPESALYDEHHAFLRALEGHDRAAALAAVERLAAAAPGHRLEWQARRALASYDLDTTARHVALEALLKLHPEDVNLQLGRLGCLRELASRNERLTWLREVSSAKGTDPLVWQELAQELSTDARENAAARRWLRRARRFRGADPSAISTWAAICWSEGQFDEALEQYRLAAFLADKREDYWHAWFHAARARGRSAEVLDLLRERFDRLGRLSAQPARTLVWVLHELDRVEEAAAIVREAVARRPEDGALVLFAAEEAVRHRRFEEAEALLQSAKGRVSSIQWLRASAWLADGRQEPVGRLEAWRAVLEQDPLALDAHRVVVQLVAEREGMPAARLYLEAVSQRFPHHVPLRMLTVEWMRDAALETYVAHVQALVTAEPTDAWAQRELALAQSRGHQHESAVASATLGVQLEPSNPAGYGILARVLREARRLDEAREAAMQSLRLSVDYSFGQGELMACCGNLEERTAAIGFIRGELERQATTGSGLLCFLDLARPFLAGDELLALAEAAHAARPDLWAAWLGLAQELRAAGRLWDARERASQAMERFPLVPRLAVELAAVHRARMEMEPCIAALERVREIEPGWGWAMRELADALVNHGDPDRARAVLEGTVRRSPLDPQSWCALGWARHRVGDVAGALDAFREAVRAEPGHEASWDALRDLGPEARRPDCALELAQEMAAERPAEARSWLVLARMTPESRVGERVEAIDRGLALSPDSTGLWRQRVLILMAAGRYPEAAASCRPACFGERPPTELRAMEAVIRSREGKMEEAVTMMQATLAEDPSLAWGWRELAGWQLELKQLDAAASSAGRLETLQPGNPEPLAFRAAIALERGQKPAAMELLARAHALDAGYVWAGRRLLGLRLESNDLNGATEVLGKLQGCLPECSWLVEAIVVEEARPGRPGLEGLVRRLMRSSGDDPDGFRRVVALFQDAGLLGTALPWIVDCLGSGGPLNLSAGEFHVRVHWCLKGLDIEPMLDRLVEGSELARRAWMTLLEAWDEHLQTASTERCQSLASRIQARKVRFKADDLLWVRAGECLMAARQMAAARGWFADWRERPGLSPSQMFTALRALFYFGSETEFEELVDRIVAHPQREDASQLAELIQAYARASRGDWELARRFGASPSEFGVEVFEKMRLVLRGLVEWVDSGKGPMPPAVRKDAFKVVLQNSTTNWMRIWMVRAMQRAASDHGGLTDVLGINVRILSAWFVRVVTLR